MKIDNTNAYCVKPWRIEENETQYIVYLDYNRLTQSDKTRAKAVADSDNKETSDYIYLAVVHVASNTVLPEQSKDGMNVMMVDRQDFNAIYNDHNLAVNNLHFVGYISKKTARYLKRSLVGIMGKLRAWTFAI